MGIHGMLAEIFSDKQLVKLEIEKYTVLFQVAINIYNENGNNQVYNDPVLCYVIVDISDEGKSETSIAVVKEKVSQLSRMFHDEYKSIDFTGEIKLAVFSRFMTTIRSALKDMLDSPNERFGKIFGSYMPK